MKVTSLSYADPKEIECKIEEGITIGIIDSLIVMQLLLVRRLKANIVEPYAGYRHKGVIEALKDLNMADSGSYIRDYIKTHDAWLMEYHKLIGTEIGKAELAKEAASKL